LILAAVVVDWRRWTDFDLHVTDIDILTAALLTI